VKKNRKFIILAVTGSIAAYKACEILSLFRDEPVDVQVVLTKEAEAFITPLTLQTLSHNKVLTDMFEIPEEWDPTHISLADKADLVIIAPATANIIGKLANGICDDLITCLTLATKAPLIIAPAMNANMYRHAVVNSNILRLKKLGYNIVGPATGYLACGREDIGRLAEPTEIFKAAKRLLK